MEPPGFGSNVSGAVQAGNIAQTRVTAAPVGVRLDFARGGIAALYRYAQSRENRGGHGFRISARAAIGRAFIGAEERVEAKLTGGGALTIVRSGPYDARTAAASTRRSSRSPESKR